MNRQKWFLMMAGVATALLMSGCKTAPASRAGGDSEEPAQRAEPASPSERLGLNRRADAHAHYAMGVAHDANGESALAMEEFQKALAGDPDSEFLILDISRRLLQAKQVDKALELLEAATKRGHATGEVYARLGTVYTRLSRGEDALAANRMAVKKSPTYIGGYQNLFVGLVQAKKQDEALKLLDDASRVRSTNADFYIGIGDLYQNYALQFPTQREATLKKAVLVLNRADELKPTESETRLRLADGYFACGDPKRAAVIYLSLISKMEDLPFVVQSVRAKLAEIYLRSDDQKGAKEQLEAIVKEDPSNAQAYYFLGSLAYDDKRWPDAVDQFKKTIALNPAFEQAYYDLTAAQLAANDAPGAVSTMTQAREKFAQNFLIEYLTALAEGRRTNYSEAIKHFTTAEILAKAKDPKRLTGEFYFEVGIVHERKGDRKEAVRYFERALELKPEFPEAQNYLGYMWAEKGENLERARELIQKALKAEPDSAAYLDSMGWVLFKLNKPKDALDYMLKAVKLNDEPDATLYDHLGDIYSALSDSDKAREAWKKSLAVEESESIRKKLDSAK